MQLFTKRIKHVISMLPLRLELKFKDNTSTKRTYIQIEYNINVTIRKKILDVIAGANLKRFYNSYII